MMVVFFISALAETNRPPFDLAEAELEIVAGFMVEYSSTPYLLFMLGEYVSIVLMCALTTILFLGGWLPPNRPPFDLPEAESELVAGFMVEYSSTPYLLFMLGEYVSIVLMCAMTAILFLGGWLPPFDVVPFTWVPGVVWFTIKVCVVFFMFAMVKTIVPRYRYDQLMRLGWKVLLPTSLAAVVGVAAFLQFVVPSIGSLAH